MAYVNVSEWKADQVCEWLRGLDSTIHPYIHSFLNHDINGQHLLIIQSPDLERLGVMKIGHQEIILGALEYLRNFHYDLDKENLQLLALRLSSQAHSLHNQMCSQMDSEFVSTQALSDVASIMMVIKPLVRWMDYPPFSGDITYQGKKSELLNLSIEMAACAQRDRFADKPVQAIRTTCSRLATLADYIIQDISDPIILEPAILDIAVLRKKSSDDLGFHILPSFHGIHQITEVKPGSAAHQTGKMMEGDEIVQVNYQTVVGWEKKHLLELFRESPAVMLLTIKRRPKHTKMYGKLYIGPYKLPSNKNTSYSKQGRNVSSPRPDLLTISDFAMPSPRRMPKTSGAQTTSILEAVELLDAMSTDSESESESESSQFYARPRNLIQRRVTITGASPTSKHGINLEQFWKELKLEHKAAVQLRDKAAPRAHGSDNVPMVNIRPKTCLGLESAKRKNKTNEQTNKKVQFEEKLTDRSTRPDDTKEKVIPMQNCDDDGANIVNKDINIEHLQASTGNVSNSNNLKDMTVPLDESNNSISDTFSINEGMPNNKSEISMQYVENRGKLDKDCSTSAYLSDTEKLFDHCLINTPNNNLTKANVSAVIENVDDHKKLKDVSSKHTEASVRRCDSNVAQKISNIEKQIAHKNAEEQTSAFGVPKRIDLRKNNVTINGINLENSTEEKNQNDQNDLEHDISDVNDKKYAAERLSTECENVNENKSVHLKNSACEYHENADCGTLEISNSKKERCNNNNNNSNSSSSNSSSSSGSSSNSNNNNSGNSGGGDAGDSSSSSSSSSTSSNSSPSNVSNSIERNKTLPKFDKTLQTVDCAQHVELLKRKFSSVLSRENCTEMKIPSHNTKSIEDDLLNVTRNVSKMQINIKQQTEEARSADLPSAQVTVQSCRFIELPKIESVRKLENKSHATPPEPPPRKYYTNQAITDLKLNNIPQTLEDLQKPQIPERLGIKREFKKVDLSSCVNHIRSNSDCQDRKDSSDVHMVNYTENSMDFIDEPRTISLSDQKFDRSNLSDALLYNENNDKQSREEKCPFEKYETFNEKFVCSDQSITDCYRFDHSRNVDCPDGITYSKQTVSSDLKPRLSEKDKSIEKSVVNRAMMVAKSIGLHSSLNKSNSSPRSSRKRNMLLAKRRNVSVRDIGTGDLEGWLTYRSRGAGGAWAKAWFVLKCSSLYRFKTQDSVKADCLIILTGFTVSPAAEVKSRKYSFKVYHTGTVFYFATDTEDNLILWLDVVNKGTLGADTQDQSVELFSETDESDSEGHKSKLKCTPDSCKSNSEKSFGSLKKSVRKDAGSINHEIVGASLDRKYLKFLGARNQNIPVPTAQFRSYRRVIPTSTPNKKEDCNSNSPDLQMTIASSTFYGSTMSQSATDTSSNSDMSDYRHAADGSVGRRLDNSQDFIAQEELAISQQDETHRQSMINKSRSPRGTPLLNDHVHVQHRNLTDNTMYDEHIRHLSDTSLNDADNIYSKTSDETSNNNIMDINSKNTNAHVHAPRQIIKDNFAVARSESDANFVNDKSYDRCMARRNTTWESTSGYAQKRKAQELVKTQKPKQDDSFHWRNMINPNKQNSLNQNTDYELNKRVQSPNQENYKLHDFLSPKNIGYSGSSNDLASHTSFEMQQCIKKDASINRKGSFNLINRHDNNSSDKHWLDSLKRGEKKSSSCDKNRLKNVAQYQPPPIPTSPFEQEGMRAAFEMHLDKNDHVQKGSRLKVLFGTKQQKPCTLDLPKNVQKTILEAGSPRFQRALFRNKYCTNQLSTRSDSPSPDDNGINQSHSSFNNNSTSQMFTQTFGSASSVNESNWSPNATTSSSKSKYNGGYSSSHKDFINSGRNLAPPVLPYIPPPTSPPPDYPGLEYPPVFEPGTYSLSDASLLRNRNKSSKHTSQ